MRRLSLLHLATAAAVCALTVASPSTSLAASLISDNPQGIASASAATDLAATTATTTTVTAVTTTTENHLPDWLQIAVSSAPLYASDTSSDQVVARLPRYTFLRVLGGGTSRLQAQAYDDNGNPGATGWVSADQVLPSAPGIDWLVASATTPLLSASDGPATTVRKLAPFTPLQRLDGPVLGRIQVRVFAGDFSSIVDQGWVDVSATGPALPPQMRVPAPATGTSGLRSPGSSGQQQAFLDAAAQAARAGAALTGVPASVTVAQAILESSWGQSALALDANNFFGMKAMGTLGNDGVVWMQTSEYDTSGQLYQTWSAFRAYKSLADSMADHDRLLADASRYTSAMAARTDPRAFAVAIAQDGYSTDPAYADKLIGLMDRYNLYQLDA